MISFTVSTSTIILNTSIHKIKLKIHCTQMQCPSAGDDCGREA